MLTACFRVTSPYLGTLVSLLAWAPGFSRVSVGALREVRKASLSAAMVDCASHGSRTQSHPIAAHPGSEVPAPQEPCLTLPSMGIQVSELPSLGPRAPPGLEIVYVQGLAHRLLGVGGLGPQD